MKKIFALLLVIFSLFTTFVSAQELKEIDIHIDTITIVRGKLSVDRPGSYELVFTKAKDTVLFEDNQIHSVMTIRTIQLVQSKHLDVYDDDKKCVSATALVFDAIANGQYEVVYSVVLLDSDKSLFAAGISVGELTIMMRVHKDAKVTQK